MDTSVWRARVAVTFSLADETPVNSEVIRNSAISLCYFDWVTSRKFVGWRVDVGKDAFIYLLNELRIN